MSLSWPNGAEIIHAGLDDVEKLKSIANITRIWIEEATELDFPLTDDKEPDLAQVDLRLRGVPPDMVGQITITFNPTQQAARLFDYVGVSTTDLPSRSHKHYDDGRVFVQHTTYLDNPYVGEDYTAVFRRLGGVMQAVYERGELVAVDAPDQLILYEWVKNAMERDPADCAHDGRQRLGCDPARYGNDMAVILRSEGFGIVAGEQHASISATDLGRRVASLASEHNVSAEMVVIDEVNLSGVLDTVRDQGIDASGFIAGASPVYCEALPDGLTFNNLRSQAWFYLRTLFQDGLISLAALPDDIKRRLQEELLAPRYRTGQEKRIEVEPKEGKSKTWGLKSRLGRSPDVADTLMMMCFADYVGSTINYAEGAF